MYPDTDTDTFEFIKICPGTDLDTAKLKVSGYFLDIDTFLPNSDVDVLRLCAILLIQVASG